MELFEQIRRDRSWYGLSISALARRHKTHRRTVRQALADAVPPPRKPPSSRPTPKLGPHHEFIDQILEDDKSAPKKQRHTIKRIHARLIEERGADVGYSTVGDYVRAVRKRSGEVDEVFIPRHHEPGHGAEVDWGEASVILDGEKTKVHLFHMRSSYSGATFVWASARENQQAFLEGHARAFSWFDGVFATLSYDNLSSAVNEMFLGRRRTEQDRFVTLRSHYGFESFYTLAGKRGAHEKGGVEGEVGRFRRNNLVPLPKVATIAQLNELLASHCEKDLARRIAGKDHTVGHALSLERPGLRCLPPDQFDPDLRVSVRVGKDALICVKQSRYSVPARLAGRKVAARVASNAVHVYFDGAKVATHERAPGRGHVLVQLDHYLEPMLHKPGALAGSLALAQERDSGNWPDCIDRLWRLLEERHTKQQAARQIVLVLMLRREVGHDKVARAIEDAIAGGVADASTICLLARGQNRATPAPIDLTHRPAGFTRPEPVLDQYDQLLAGVAR